MVGCTLNLTGDVPTGGGKTTETADDGGGASDAAIAIDAAPATQSDASTAPTCAPADVSPSSIPAWSSPRGVTRGACSAADLTEIESLSSSQTILASDVIGDTRISSACRACAFSYKTDSQWQAYVFDPKTGDGFVNYGACVAAAPMGTKACGQAVQAYRQCVTIACATPSCGDNATACRGMVTSGTCAGESSEMTTACGSALANDDAMCGDSLYTNVKYLCGG
jgi:hypothetical protein